MSPKQPLRAARLALSRRDFLRLSGAALVSAVIKPAFGLNASPQNEKINTALAATANQRTSLAGFPELTSYNQGRVIEMYAEAHTYPAFDAPRNHIFWRDQIIPITGIAISEDTSSHNLIWYQAGEHGYVHSGVIQPVKATLNEVSTDIPEVGTLAETTVPYTDAHWSPSRDTKFAYRFYYETTQWVKRHVRDKDGQPWYAVIDDKWGYEYFVQAQHLRLVPRHELAPISPLVPDSAKRIEVLLSSQIAIAYENNKPVFVARVATGGKFRDGDFTTPTGHYITNHKRPTRHMAAGNLAAGGYDLPGVPWNSYITPSGIAIHGTYWHNNFGRPRSHGCINLSSKNAKWIYLWTSPVVPSEEIVRYENFGTAVEVIE